MRLNGSTLNNNGTFTQSDIDNNRLSYQNTNGSATSDNFTFTLADGGENGVAAVSGLTFSININPPTNNAPTASSFTSRRTTINGASNKLRTDEFGYSDQDADPLDNVLIERIPAAGTLYVDANGNNSLDANEALSNGDRVTASDLNAERLKYFQNGTTDTNFQFEVNDGTDDSSGNYIVTLNVADSFSMNSTRTLISCNNGSDGAFAINPTGWVPPYSIFWSTGNGGGPVFATDVLTVDNLSAGSYVIRVVDAEGNSFQLNTSLPNPAVLTASASVTQNVTTPGGSDGRARATATGGTTPYSYSWSNGDDTRNISGLTAGTYTVDIIDANGCTTAQQSVTITEPVDNTGPTVTSVSVPSNATYTEGQNLDFTINFNEDVIVDTTNGTPQLALTIGSTTRQAVYQSGSGTSSLLFRYIVQDGDNDTNGITVGSLAANGGSLQDAAGNDANLALNNVGNTTQVLVGSPAPSGYTVMIDQDPITNLNEDSVSFSFTLAEVGTTYNYTFTSSNGGTPVTGTGTIATATDQITGIDLSGLNDGAVTLTATLADGAGNVGSNATDMVFKVQLTAVPYVQNFDAFSAGPTSSNPSYTLIENWTNEGGDSFDWTTDRNNTGSGSTGPSADHTRGDGTGTYLYLESSGGGAGRTASMTTPYFDLTSASTGTEMSFWYHMFGATIGSLEVEIRTSSSPTWIPLIAPFTDNVDLWQQSVTNLDSYLGDTVQFRFIGTTGTSFTGDIGFDDFYIGQSPGFNDDLVNAALLQNDQTSLSKPYNFTGTTVEAGESFTTYNGNPVSSNTTGSLWFKFVATTTDVLIRTESDDVMNLALQLVDATNATPGYSDLSNYRGRYGNDLNGDAYEPWISEQNLTIGETYFVQVHNMDGANTYFDLIIEEARFYIFGNGSWFTALGNPDGITDPYASVIIANGSPTFTAANMLIGDLGIGANATFTIPDNSTLTVNGRLITGSAGTSIDAGTGSTLSFIGHGNDFLFENVAIIGVSNLYDVQVVDRFENSVGSPMNISGSFKSKNNLTVGSTTVTFKHNADDLGILANDPQFPGMLLGNVTVENYIPERTGAEKRAFRFLGSSVIPSSTIFDQWQEGGNSPAGFGTHITGSTGTVGTIDPATGLDQTISGNNSLYTYNASAAAWNAINSTNQAGDVLTTGEGYRLFVRGDRNVDLSSNTSSSNTTLRSSGTLSMADKSLNYDVDGGQFVLIANPYQNAMSIEDLIDDSSNVTDDVVYYWDPNLGGAAGLGAYVTYTGFDNGGSGSGLPASSNNNGFIQPGQAVFLVANAGADGVGNDMTVNFSNSQISESGVLRGAGNRVNGIANGNGDRITMNLYDTFSYDNSYSVTDAMMIRFSGLNSNTVGTGDFVKAYNAHESIAISQEAGDYAIASREMPLTSEILQLKHYNYGDIDYTYVIEVEGLMGSTVFLYDNYLNTSTALVTGDNVIAFSVDTAIAGSMDVDRFQLRFEDVTLGTGDVNLAADFIMYPNPSDSNKIVTLKSSNFSSVETTLRITDLSGKLISLKKVKFNNQGIFELATGAFKTGIYLVELTDTENQKVVRKLVIE